MILKVSQWFLQTNFTLFGIKNKFRNMLWILKKGIEDINLIINPGFTYKK